MATVRALMPRVWAGEDISDDLAVLEAEAIAAADHAGECACLYLRSSLASEQQDALAGRTLSARLIDRAQTAGLPVWESLGRHFFVYLAVDDGHEDEALNDLVVCEVLTDGAPVDVVLGAAFTSIAGAYSGLGLFEDGERMFGRIEDMVIPFAASGCAGEHVQPHGEPGSLGAGPDEGG